MTPEQADQLLKVLKEIDKDLGYIGLILFAVLIVVVFK